MAKLNTGTRIYGTANVDTSIGVGGNVVVNTSVITIGNSSVNVVVNSSAVYVSGAPLGGATNAAAQYAWTNTHSFSAVVTHTANVSVNGAIIANGGAGTSGQVLTSAAGGNVYWSTAAGGFSNGASISVANLAITGSLTAANSVGTSGQALISTGTGVQWGTSSPGYNYSSRFDGGSYLTSATAAVPSTGTFTVEFWMYTSLSTLQILFGQYTSADANRWMINIDNSTGYKLSVSHGVAATLFGATVVPLNQWNHVAVVRDASNNLKIYLNGILDATAASYTYTMGQTASRISGFNNTGTYNFTGYISNLRVTNTAVYTAAFTPTTTPLSAISGTTLLVCNAITPTSESSSGAVGITNNGNGVTTTATFSPFTSTTVSIPTQSLTAVRQQFVGDGSTTTFNIAGGYTPNAISVFVTGVLYRNGSDVTVTNGSTIVFATAPLSGALIDVIGTVPTTYSSITPQGYSVQFNGSNYLSVADSAALQPGSSNYTVEAWIYPTAFAGSANGASIISKTNSASLSPYILSFSSTGQLGALVSNNGSTWAVNISTPAVSLNSWYHVALVRNSSTVTLYVNGLAANSGSVSGTVYASAGNALMIGNGNYGGSYFTGYISNARVVVGTAVYTAPFTPVGPLTAVQSATSMAAAITGTQTGILTCNAPTIIDGSTNAFTITNNGSAPVSTSIVPTFTNVTINNPSTLPSYLASYLIVAGGGAGGVQHAGGGGGGGVVQGTTTLTPGTTYTVVVGGGGAALAGGSNGTNPAGNPGSNSSITGLTTAIGGGGGGSYRATDIPNAAGSNGGSGGGGGSIESAIQAAGYGGLGGLGALGQGYNGAAGAYAGGGGGGAGGNGLPGSGGNGGGNVGGAGGPGIASNITGSYVGYGGGGGGGSYNGYAGLGASLYGGANGAVGTGTVASNAGTTNTGGGGGGGAAFANASGAGGSGVVIISVLSSVYTGITTGSPTVTTNGLYKVIKFTASGSYTA